MMFHTGDTWEHSVHGKRFPAKFVSTWADIARGQLVCRYMDASIFVAGVLVLGGVSEVSSNLQIRFKEVLTIVMMFLLSANIAKFNLDLRV